MTNGWKTWAPARCGRLLLLCVGLAVAQTALAEGRGRQGMATKKAQGKAGYLCDYVMGYGSNMASNSPAIEGMMRSGAATQGRFVKRDGGWIALDN